MNNKNNDVMITKKLNKQTKETGKFKEPGNGTKKLRLYSQNI
jgi:hypothetical protein